MQPPYHALPTMSDPANQPSALTAADRIGRGLYFTLLFLAIFAYPAFLLTELDSSWRQVLTYGFVHGWQVGQDLIFTYGPLGFLMGNTYSGLVFWPFILWQVIMSLIFAGIIFRQGLRLPPYPRAFFWAIMVTVGVCYPDALHMIIIVLLGFELLRDAGAAPRRWTVGSLVLLAVLTAVKFTNMMLAGFVVLVAVSLELALRRPRAAARLALWYGGAFLLVWLLCGQNPLNLPAYVLNSLRISSGYEQTMGLSTPDFALHVGLPVLGILIVYAFIHLAYSAEKPRALARCLVLGAFTYLNWKHGFVRADGHLIGFHICALMVLTGFPGILDDSPRMGWVRWVLLLPAVGFCFAGLQNPLPVTRNLLALFQDKVFANVYNTLHFPDYYREHRDKVRAARAEWDLPRTRAVVGDAPMDYLGYTQAVLLHNRFNYRPRPVIQNYSAYTPALAQINADFYASDRAPDYVLFRLEWIDGRYPPLEDARTLHVFMHRYDFVHTEKGFQLWKLRAGPFDAAALAPRPLRTVDLPLGQSFALEQMSAQRLWLKADLRPSLLGRLRDFFYKPPLVQLRLVDTRGNTTLYRLPLPMARGGFMLNPIIGDVFGFMRFASDQAQHRVKEVSLVVDEADRKYFAPRIRLEFSELPASNAGKAYLTQAAREQFSMFKSVPIVFEAQTVPSVTEVDGAKVIVLHAPSEMVFQLEAGARRITGGFGLLPGAWSSGGNTNGANFTVYWSNGVERITLFERYLAPVREPKDRGLQQFDVALPDRRDGQIFLNVGAGAENNFSWDWSFWTGIEIK